MVTRSRKRRRTRESIPLGLRHDRCSTQRQHEPSVSPRAMQRHRRRAHPAHIKALEAVRVVAVKERRALLHDVVLDNGGNHLRDTAKGDHGESPGPKKHAHGHGEDSRAKASAARGCSGTPAPLLHTTGTRPRQTEPSRPTGPNARPAMAYTLHNAYSRPWAPTGAHPRHGTRATLTLPCTPKKKAD